MILSDGKIIYLLIHTIEKDEIRFKMTQSNCEMFKDQESLISFVSKRVGTERPIKLEKILRVDPAYGGVTEYGLQFDIASMEFSLVEKEGVKET